MYNELITQAYKTGVLSEEVHKELVRDIKAVLKMANITPNALLTTCAINCTEEEINWLLKVRTSETNLVYTNVDLRVSIETRMMSAVGLCVRNYIDARMFTVQQVIVDLKNGVMPSPTVLFIPNFFISKAAGGHLAPWETSDLLGLLISRLASGKKTALYISSMKCLNNEYGKAFSQHIVEHYRQIS